MSDPIILVTGATGHQGGATIAELLRRARPWRLRALVRTPTSSRALALAQQGVQVVQGDLDNEASLRAALKDVYGVLSVQSPMKIGPAGEERQGKLLATLSAELGVQHFIQCSAGGVDRHSGVPHFESKLAIEQHITVLGLRATILRPAAFMENFSTFVFRTTMLSMMKTYLAADQSMQVVSVRDVGWFAAEAFKKPADYLDRAIELAGDAVTVRDAALTLRHSGKTPVIFFTLPPALRTRLPEDFRLMFEWIARDGFHADIPTLKHIHPTLLSLSDWAKQS
ncbi:NmrA/HSCARG family protein [Gluconobacter roseus]|uniref:NmrA family transcriptional regulator n=1 Tax=Gluconobacter roseus NBRC 3990 TaxID=1307950 RepID=A0A4Y3MAQ0_9PROT|nr:NmrA/HSCARG family protein [Gluconobacter roseus]KXV44373.1 NmrA family protein [Gluconobacter roseus]GBR48086.1 putative nucleoside-diphosphate-sugar epimerase [Gluconobacter roseus NBRC 3990]GEB03419.1 NmrA family transcriptional regulator [Gluconobacter roseus NBRC 3990]GLP93877.1 NmrA family transcriptional regulator [Gluconobacter roseus NBRC 3990]